MTDPDNALLSCRGTSKYFGAMAAVKDLDLEVAQGEVLGIGGPNGAGKTTLFELISGFNPPETGEVYFQGERIDRLLPHAICHRGIARVFQSNASFDSLTVRQSAMLGAAFGRSRRWMPPLVFDPDARDRAEAALDFVGLSHRADEVAENLPVLDRKMLMFASAIASDPKLILMDEPVGGLNPQEIDEVVKLVRKLIDQGVTIMLIEHVMRFLTQLSTRVVILHHGEKIFEGPPSGLAKDETVKTVYLGERVAQRVDEYVRQAGQP